LLDGSKGSVESSLLQRITHYNIDKGQYFEVDKDSMEEEYELYWKNYLSTLPLIERPVDAFVEVSVAGTHEVTDELIQLYKDGVKSAGSGLLEDFLMAGDDLPEVGQYWMVLNSEDKPKIILKCVEVETNKWRDISEKIVRAEAGENSTIESWKEEHLSLYSPYLKEWGINDINDASVITEHFQLMFKSKN
jgi:uncharacterized protein YhfF